MPHPTRETARCHRGAAYESSDQQDANRYSHNRLPERVLRGTGLVQPEALLHGAWPGEKPQHPLTPGGAHRIGFAPMIANPPQPGGQCPRFVGRHDETGDAVFDDFRHARDVRTDRRRPARHAFEQRLPQQLRNGVSLPSNARYTLGSTTHIACRYSRTRASSSSPCRNVTALPASERAQPIIRRRIGADRRRSAACRLAAPQSDRRCPCAEADGRRNTPRFPRDTAESGENFSNVNAAANDLRPRACMTVNTTAVFAQVQVTVEPGVSGQ